MKQLLLLVSVCVSCLLLVGTVAAQTTHQFSDVPPDNEAYGPVKWAASVGITVGYGDGTFRPDVLLIERHALLFLERYFVVDGCAQLTSANLGVLGVPSYRRTGGSAEAVLRVVAQHFAPPDGFTRADMVTMLHEACGRQSDSRRSDSPARRLKCERDRDHPHIVYFWHTHPIDNDAPHPDMVGKRAGSGTGGYPSDHGTSDHTIVESLPHMHVEVQSNLTTPLAC